MRFPIAILAAVLALGAMGPSAEARRRPRVAEVVADLAKATEAAQAKVTKSEKKRTKLVSAKSELSAQYQRELTEVDKLKKQKASWRRDRKLRDKMASSLETAKQLATTTADLATLDGTLRKQRKALIAAIDNELAAGTKDKRSKTLRTLRGEVVAKVGAGKKAKKIVLPDDEIDPLADPEDLEAQAKALRDSEAELAKQISSLEKQASRFRKQAELKEQHERADELASRDDGQPRRTSGSSGRGGEAAPTSEGVGDDDAADPSPDPGAFEGDPAVVLSDVVDGDTVDALRKAERSTDPATKADAAERARKAVAARLQKLEKRRKEIEKRARELRDE